MWKALIPQTVIVPRPWNLDPPLCSQAKPRAAEFLIRSFAELAGAPPPLLILLWQIENKWVARCSSVRGQGSNHQEPKQPRAAAAPFDLRELDERGSEDGEEGAQMKTEGKRQRRGRRGDLWRICTSQWKSHDCAQSNADTFKKKKSSVLSLFWPSAHTLNHSCFLITITMKTQQWRRGRGCKNIYILTDRHKISSAVPTNN